MEIEEIHNNKFKIFLHKEDLDRYNIKLDSFLAEKLENQKILLDILDYLDQNSLICLNNKNLSINTFILHHSDIVITIIISRFFSSDNFFCFKLNNILKLKNCNYFISIFDNYDILYDFFCSISNNLSKKFLSYLEIYEFKNKYFLFINSSNFNTSDFNYIILQILEFSTHLSFSEIFISKIQEFGNKLNFIKKF